MQDFTDGKLVLSLLYTRSCLLMTLQHVTKSFKSSDDLVVLQEMTPYYLTFNTHFLKIVNNTLYLYYSRICYFGTCLYCQSINLFSNYTLKFRLCHDALTPFLFVLRLQLVLYQPIQYDKSPTQA